MNGPLIFESLFVAITGVALAAYSLGVKNEQPCVPTPMPEKEWVRYPSKSYCPPLDTTGAKLAHSMSRSTSINGPWRTECYYEVKGETR